MAEEEGINISKFNAGILQTGRIGKLQDQMNEVRTTPFVRDSYSGKYGYEAWFECINSCYQEVRPKLKSDDQLKGDVFRETIRYLIRTFGVVKRINSRINQGVKVRIIEKNWEVIRTRINLWEEMVRQFLEKHKMNSPTKSESGMF